MSLDIDELKKKIIYRSSYRGTKEMDILLSSFVKDVINHLDNDELENLFNLLNIDDDNLFKWYLKKYCKMKIPKNKVSSLLRNFKLK